MRIRGFLRRQGLAATRLFIEGTLVAGSLRASMLVGRGVVVAESLHVDYAVFTGSVNAGELNGGTLVLRGDVRLGEARAERIIVEGRLKATGIRASRLTLRASASSRIGFLSARIAEISSEPPALRGKARIHVGELWADRLRAEYLVARSVNARRAVLGPMCRVGILSYCSSVSLDNTVMLGEPPRRLCADQRPSITERS